MEFVVAPFDQRFPVVLLDVRVTFSPAQIESEPMAEIVGCGTVEVTVTVMAEDVAVVPLFVTFTA